MVRESNPLKKSARVGQNIVVGTISKTDSDDAKKTLRKIFKGIGEGSIYAAGRCSKLEKSEERKYLTAEILVRKK